MEVRRWRWRLGGEVEGVELGGGEVEVSEVELGGEEMETRVHAHLPFIPLLSSWGQLRWGTKCVC